MKRFIIVLLTGSMLLSAVNNVQANESDRELKERDVNANALTHFTRNNKNASSVTWTTANAMLSVYFTKDNVKCRSTYNAKGQWEYTLRYMNAVNSPRKIVALIKGNYSMNIVQVTEVQRKGYTYHLVKMEDEKSFLTVQVLNGEIDFYEQIIK